MRHTQKKFYLFVLLIVMIIAVPAISSAEEEAWWTQDYTFDSETVTTYSYGSETVEENTSTPEGSGFVFSPRSVVSAESVPSEFKSHYDWLATYCTQNPGSTTEQRISAVAANFTDLSDDVAALLVKTYDFVTATGQYAFLNETPKQEEVSLYDTWFHFFATKYPKPPRTLKELTGRKREAIRILSLQSHYTKDELQALILRMDAYISKYGLDPNIPLSQALQEAATATSQQ